MSERDSGSFVAGFIVGAIVGAILGLFLAPRPGEETRQLVKEKLEDVKERVSGAARKAGGIVAEITKKAQEKI